MISTFPNFKRLELKDKREISKFISKFPPHSDYNFPSLWSYNIKNDLTVSYLNGNLVVKFRDYITNQFFYSFIGSNQLIATVNLLLDQAKKQKMEPELLLIPEDNLAGNPELSQTLSIKEDPRNHDYILSLKEHANLGGKKYHRHRKSIARFSRLYPQIKPQLLNIKKKLLKKQIIELFQIWYKRKGKNYEDIEHELIALRRILAHPDYLNLVGYGMYHNSKLISFLIVDIGHPEYAESHFSKTHPDYIGATQVMRYFSSKHLNQLGLKYLNIEQDMGIESLRYTKNQWKPVFFLKKYIISEKESLIKQ